MNRLLPSTVTRLSAVRGLSSAAPTTTTGIEHQDEANKRGLKTPVDPKLYKCAEYLHFNKYSFYDPEIKMASARVPQPTNKKPDVQPKFK